MDRPTSRTYQKEHLNRHRRHQRNTDVDRESKRNDPNIYIIDEDDKEQIFLIKQEALIELKLISESLGLDVHTKYTMKDDLSDVQFEIRRLLILDEKRQAVESMRGTISMVASGLEVVNYQLGNNFELNGFSRAVAKEAKDGRYDLPLQKLYKKHWKTGVGTGNPEYDLARALVTSAGMYHVKKSGMASEVMSKVTGMKQ
tara:strand:- start:636 stop:1235 length:600 start_codon:yes stop_codon:yes gene_type:complete